MEDFSVWLESRQSNPEGIIQSLITDVVSFNRETKEKDAELVAAGASHEERSRAYYDILDKYANKPLNKVVVGAAAGGLALNMIVAPFATATLIGLSFVALALLNVRASYGDKDAAKQAAKLAKAVKEAKENAKTVGAEEVIDEAEEKASTAEEQTASLTDNEALMKLMSRGIGGLSVDEISGMVGDAAIEINGTEDDESRNADIDVMRKIVHPLISDSRMMKMFRVSDRTRRNKIFDDWWEAYEAGIISEGELHKIVNELTDHHFEIGSKLYERKKKSDAPSAATAPAAKAADYDEKDAGGAIDDNEDDDDTYYLADNEDENDEDGADDNKDEDGSDAPLSPDEAAPAPRDIAKEVARKNALRRITDPRRRRKDALS